MELEHLELPQVSGYYDEAARLLRVTDTIPLRRLVETGMNVTPQQQRQRIVSTLDEALTLIDRWHESGNSSSIKDSF